MKRRILMLIFAIGSLITVSSFTACSKKTGCPMNEYTKKDKKLNNKKGKSNLFPKSMRKKG